MTISEIISAITRKIKDKYPEVTVYKDKVKQGFKTPCFFVTCLNGEQNKVGRNKYNRDYLFNIRFHMKEPDRVELLIKGEEIQELLQEIKNGNELLRGKELKYEIVDDILQFFVSYKQGFVKVEDRGPLMENLDLKEGVN
ncbi:phage tail terminator family protein [Clostridium cadaveris]|uniref:phage tail terminator family protein n=1 Tax=Clostridium cadaveris TaxID=1529 RepID=UPI000C079ED6|nr:hypothetical protein [Clostridium cadaveris]